MKPAALGLVASAVAALASTGLADDLRVVERFEKTKIAFDMRGRYRDVTLTVIGPHEFDVSVFSRRGAPAIDLSKFGTIDDGTYTYQLSAAGEEKIKVRSDHNNGRDAGADTGRLRSVSASGTFLVMDGVIVAGGAAGDSGKSDRDQQ